MAQIKTKFLEADAVDGSKIKLNNAESLRARNAANSADVNLFNLDGSDNLVFQTQPEYGVDPSADNHLARKKYVDDQIAGIPATFQIQGNWNASTNTPTLASSTNSTGDVNPLYIVNVAGTTSIDGIALWAVGDWIYFANGIWNKADNVDDVVSVAGKTGIVTLDTDDVSEGTNLYHTTARAKAAAVADSITDAVTDVAPSQNAVFDALALKADDNAVVKLVGSSMGSAANITFSGGGEVLGLPATPSAGGASSKEYVDAQVGAVVGADAESEVNTLDGTDMTNKYIDLGFPGLAGSFHLSPVGGPLQEEVVDYSVSLTGGAGGVTRLSWSALGLDGILASGDKLMIKYLRA